METDLIYQIKNLSFGYTGNVVLNIPSFNIKKNFFYVLKGDNGSGKTTLLKILSGLIKIKRGEILFNNHPISYNRYLNVHKSVSYLHQSPLMLNGTVLDNISYGLKLRHIDKNTQLKKSEQVLAKVGLSEFAFRKAKNLSSGEMQRVALARAIVFDPKVVLLDEPVANIDEKSHSLIEKVLLTLTQENKTIIMSSHNSIFTSNLPCTLLEMKNGTIQQI